MIDAFFALPIGAKIFITVLAFLALSMLIGQFLARIDDDVHRDKDE